MDSSRLRVFVSSKMQELAPERLAVKSALDELKVDGWVFEADAGARPQPVRQTYREEVEKADLYVGLFWKGYGDYTIEEYEHARQLGKDCLVYEKRAGVEGQRDARLEGFLRGLGEVESGLTVQWFDTPEELRELVKRDVARWQAGIVRSYKVAGAPLVYQNPSPPETKTRKELAILLNKVEQFWVKGVLENSVHHQVFIELGKKRMAEAVEHPWETVLELPREADVSLPGGGRIAEIFADADVGHYLLILGAPGSGKTTTLLELARDLIEEAGKDRSQPIPTVFNLSSWAGGGESIADWMVKELKAKYQIPDRTGRAWVEEHHLLPLLDGLDEVSPDLQAACVDAINEFVQGYPSGLVVCSRLQEYTGLPVRLKLNGAVCLQPLSPEQADDYLTKAGPELAALREALREDENLRELTQTPLMLSIMSLAYEGQPPGALAGAGLDTFESRRRHVFDTYIERMFQRKGTHQPYTKESVTAWLCWLARKMKSHSQSIFLVEQLQPGWLSNRSQWVTYLLISRLLAGLLWGAAVGLPFAVVTYMNTEEAPVGWALHYWKVACTYGLALGLVTWLVNCIKAALGMRLKFIAEASGVRSLLFDVGPYAAPWVLSLAILMWNNGKPFDVTVLVVLVGLGFVGGMIHWLVWESRGQRWSLSNDILTVETLGWSWPYAYRSARQWMVITFIVMAILSLAFMQDNGIVFNPGRSYWESLKSEAVSMFTTCVVASLVTGPIGLLLGGFKRGVTGRKTTPNQGITLSIRNAVLGGVTAGLIAALLGVAVFIYVTYAGAEFRKLLVGGLQVALFVGIVIGLMAAFRNGGYDVLKHYVLRFILYRKGHMPRKYTKVLDYAARLILLQKVGGGYIFIHRLLLEHFAGMEGAGGEGAASDLGRTQHA